MKKQAPPHFVLEAVNQNKIITWKQRNQLLSRAIRTLYISGWKYTETLELFEGNQEYYRNARKITNYVYTRDERINLFGFWINFNFLLPLQALCFAIEELGLRSIKTSGFIFSLAVHHKIRDGVSNKLEEAMDQHSNDEIIQQLSSLDSKNGLLFLENPSQFLAVAAIDKKTSKNILAKLNSMQKFKITMYSEPYNNQGTIGTRLWISGYKPLLKMFKKFRRENKERFRVFTSSLTDVAKGGININDIDEALLAQREIYQREMQSFINRCKIDDNDIKANAIQYEIDTRRRSDYSDLLRRKKDTKLKSIIAKYEDLFSSIKITYLHHIGVSANPLLRIYRNGSKYRIACQVNLLNYNVLLSTLYGDKDTLAVNTNNSRSILASYSDLIRGTESKELMSDIAKLRFTLITGYVGHALHPISNLSLPDQKGRHFEDIENCSKPVSSMNKKGVKIDIVAAREIRKELSGKMKTIKESAKVSFDELPPYQLPELSIDYEWDDTNGSDIEFESMDKIKRYRKEIRKLLGAAQNINSKGTGRAKSHYTTHRSNTHRMTSRRPNIQGTPKYLRNRLFIPGKNCVLLSADITGQDLAITVSMARIMADDKKLAKVVSPELWEHFISNIGNTVEKFRNIPQPINFIRDKVLAELSSSSQYDYSVELHEIDENKLRGIVKAYVYTKFYGGSYKSLLIDLRKSLIDGLMSEIDYCLPFIDEERLIKLLCKISRDSQIDDLVHVRIEVEDMYRNYLFNNVQGGEPLYYKLDYTIAAFNAYEKIYKIIEDKIDEEFPGLLSVFDIFHEYSQRHPDKLIYPTALGFETPIDEYYPEGGRHISTKSKAYVIQATGAELMRRWLIELNATNEFQTRKFALISAIHDQVLVECNIKYLDDIKRVIKDCLRLAAIEMGLLQDTIQIPVIKVKYETSTFFEG